MPWWRRRSWWAAPTRASTTSSPTPCTASPRSASDPPTSACRTASTNAWRSTTWPAPCASTRGSSRTQAARATSSAPSRDPEQPDHAAEPDQEGDRAQHVQVGQIEDRVQHARREEAEREVRGRGAAGGLGIREVQDGDRGGEERERLPGVRLRGVGARADALELRDLLARVLVVDAAELAQSEVAAREREHVGQQRDDHETPERGRHGGISSRPGAAGAEGTPRS